MILNLYKGQAAKMQATGYIDNKIRLYNQALRYLNALLLASCDVGPYLSETRVSCAQTSDFFSRIYTTCQGYGSVVRKDRKNLVNDRRSTIHVHAIFLDIFHRLC